jgi:hypothetical protein
MRISELSRAARGLAAVAALTALPMSATQAGPSISIVPSPLYVTPGQSVQMEARVRGPGEYRVKWILQAPVVGEADAGTLTEDGHYTAPQAPPRGPVRIVAQVSTGKWNLPVAAASTPVRVLPPGAEPPEPPARPQPGRFPQPPEPPPRPEPPGTMR